MSGAYYNPNGLNIPDMLRHALNNRGMLEGYAGAQRISGDELLTLDVDMLIPAALGDVITEKNAKDIKAS